MRWPDKVLLTMGTLFLGCAGASGREAPSPVASSGGEQEASAIGDEELSITFNLEHAALPDVARIFGGVTQLAVVVDASVDPFAECLTISVLNPNRITVDEMVEMTARAYASVGVEVRRTGSEIMFSRMEGTTFPPCNAPRAQSRASPPQTPETPPASTAERRAALVAQIRQGMHEEGNERLLTRATRDLLLSETMQVFERARIIPHQSNGQVDSIKLYGIRRESALGVLGLQNGDGIRQINGLDVTSPDATLEAYVQLRTATEFHVELERRGQPLTLHYRIVESLPTP